MGHKRLKWLASDTIFFTLPFFLLAMESTSCSACFSSSVSDCVSSCRGPFFSALSVVGVAGMKTGGLERVGPSRTGPEVGLFVFESMRARRSVPRSSKVLVFPNSALCPLESRMLWMKISFLRPLSKKALLIQLFNEWHILRKNCYCLV